MRHSVRWRSYAILCGALFVLFSVQWSLTAQAPVKRPLSYDVFDSWRSIGGTRLSVDGQWLAYALTSQGEDGELVVRNLKSGQELRQPRGNGPTFTPDGKFLIFTIAPPKSDDTPQAEEAAGGNPPETGQAQPAGRGRARGGGGASDGRRRLRGRNGIRPAPHGRRDRQWHRRH